MTGSQIGNVTFKSRALLAPMAGISDRAYRELCVSYGAGYCVSEMVSSKALSFKDKKSEELMMTSSEERPCGIQIFGDEPSTMADAALSAMKHDPDIIDINLSRSQNQRKRKRLRADEDPKALRRYHRGGRKGQPRARNGKDTQGLG